MFAASKILDAAVNAEIQARVNKLRAKTFAELVTLPDASTEEVSMHGKTVTFTTFCEKQSSRLLVLVRSDHPVSFGLVSMGRTEGFWMELSGAQTIASVEDVLDFF